MRIWEVLQAMTLRESPWRRDAAVDKSSSPPSQALGEAVSLRGNAKTDKAEQGCTMSLFGKDRLPMTPGKAERSCNAHEISCCEFYRCGPSAMNHIDVAWMQ